MPSSRQIGVGFFMMTGLLLFGVGLFLIGNRRQLFQESFVVHAEFARVAGLQNGANVRVAGLEAGEVQSIVIPPGPEAKFRVQMRVLEKLHPLVRLDSVASIQTDGIVGNKIVQISAGRSGSSVVPAGGTIDSREPFELADLMERGSEAFDMVYESVVTIRNDFEESIRLTAEVAEHADDLIETTAADLEKMATAGRLLVEDAQVIVQQVRAGEGTVGRLLQDDVLYRRATDIAGRVDTTLQEVSVAAGNLRKLSERSERVLAGLFREEGGREGVLREIRATLGLTKEAMGDFAENMESLKRNWFFRGLFRDRGFYDLERLSPADYRQLGEKKEVVRRKWLPAERLFETLESGNEGLSPAGKELLDKAMADFLRFPQDSPLIVEAYSGEPRRDKRYLHAQRRARIVQNYLIDKYDLNPNYVGGLAMPERDPEGFGVAEEGGVVLALFHARGAGSAPGHR